MRKLVEKNNKGTALLMTLLILTSILVVVLGAANLIVPGIKMSRTQAQSTKAFFASEAGVEKALWELRKNDYNIPEVDTDNVFSETLDYYIDGADITFTSTGYYQQTRRSVAVTFQVSGDYGGCTPDCTSKSCGDDDGCGAPCPSTCLSYPGCRTSQLSNSVVNSSSCCEGSCYECAEGYYWDGAECIEIYFEAATFDGWCWDCPEYTYPDPLDPLYGDIKEYIDFKFQ
jgi:hypothetical protein